MMVSNVGDEKEIPQIITADNQSSSDSSDEDPNLVLDSYM